MIDAGFAVILVLFLIGLVIILFIYDKKNDRLDKIASIATELTNIKTTITNNQAENKRDIDALKSGFESLKVVVSNITDLQKERDVVMLNDLKKVKDSLVSASGKGKVGEKILDTIISKLPAEWYVKDFYVGNKVVEFGVKLSNGKIVPIDSKWTSVEMLDELAKCDDAKEFDKLKVKIENNIVNRAKEMRKYLDPTVTYTLGIIAVPDSLSDMISDTQAKLAQDNIVIIPYGYLLQYILLLYNSIKDTTISDMKSIINNTRAIQEKTEGKLSTAIVMLTNYRDEVRTEVGKIITQTHQQEN